MLSNKGGVPFHGEFQADGATPGPIVLYNTATRAVLSVGANDQVVIMSYHIMTTAAVIVSLLSGITGAAGSVLRSGSFPALGGMAGSGVELVCKKGEVPYISTDDTSVVYAMIEGRIFKANG